MKTPVRMNFTRGEGWRRRSRQRWRHPLNFFLSLGCDVTDKGVDDHEAAVPVCSAEFHAKVARKRFCSDRRRKRASRVGITKRWPSYPPVPQRLRRWSRL
jgi:hypothetical protein